MFQKLKNSSVLLRGSAKKIIFSFICLGGFSLQANQSNEEIKSIISSSSEYESFSSSVESDEGLDLDEAIDVLLELKGTLQKLGIKMSIREILQTSQQILIDAGMEVTDEDID